MSTIKVNEIQTVNGTGTVSIQNPVSLSQPLELKNSGTSFGQLTLTDTNNLSIGCTTADHVGITFGNTLLPRMNESNNDGGVDIGAPSFRFKDIYLAGNVIVSSGKGIDFSSAAATTSGQTGSQDPVETSTGTILDDYEEGYFTPVSNSVTGGTITAVGMYVKVGNLVNVTVRFNPSGANTNAHQFDIYLPFKAASTQASGSYNTWTGVTRFASSPAFGPQNAFVEIAGNGNTAGIRRQDQSSIFQVRGADVGTGFNMDFTLTYRTV